jgi:hypothetical protein
MFDKIVDCINGIDIDDDQKKELYNTLLEVFESFDYDIIYECSGLDSVLDEVINEYYGLDTDK